MLVSANNTNDDSDGDNAAVDDEPLDCDTETGLVSCAVILDSKITKWVVSS